MYILDLNQNCPLIAYLCLVCFWSFKISWSSVVKCQTVRISGMNSATFKECFHDCIWICTFFCWYGKFVKSFFLLDAFHFPQFLLYLNNVYIDLFYVVSIRILYFMSDCCQVAIYKLHSAINAAYSLLIAGKILTCCRFT